MKTVLAVTGGIACGKSYCCERLSEVLEAGFFSCDDEVSKLLTDRKIIGRLAKAADVDLLNKDGDLNRKLLRKIVFGDSTVRKKVEEILHPIVLDSAVSFLNKRGRKKKTSIIEVPLLYEVDFPLPRDFDLVIGCSKGTQIKRLRESRGIDPNQAERILESQLPIQEKVDRGDFVIWNNGSIESFDDQILRISEFLSKN